MEFRKWLRARIDDRQLTEQALEEITARNGEKVPQATINRILRNETKDPRKSTVDALVRALDGNPDAWMAAGDGALAPRVAEAAAWMQALPDHLQLEAIHYIAYLESKAEHQHEHAEETVQLSRQRS